MKKFTRLIWQHILWFFPSIVTSQYVCHRFTIWSLDAIWIEENTISFFRTQWQSCLLVISHPLQMRKDILENMNWSMDSQTCKCRKYKRGCESGSDNLYYNACREVSTEKCVWKCVHLHKHEHEHLWLSKFWRPKTVLVSGGRMIGHFMNSSHATASIVWWLYPW